MAKAYWINTFRSISDQDKLAAYVELAGPAMRAAGGTFLARGLPAAAFESGIVERTTLIEFPSVEAAVAAYESRPTRTHWRRWATARSGTCGSSPPPSESTRLARATRPRRRGRRTS